MTDTTSGLARAQRVMSRLIRHPEGVEAALAEEPGGTLEGLVRTDSKLSATGRVSVYANAYLSRILEVLSEDFGSLSSSLGEAAFQDLVSCYLIVHPSRSPSLRWLGDDLPGFYRSHAAAEPFRAAFPYGPDLATLDRALVSAFDAAEAPAADRSLLASLSPEDFADLALVAVPGVSLVDAGHGVGALRRAFDAGDTPPLSSPEPRAVRLCVWRQAGRAHHRECDAAEFEVLSLLVQGTTFGLVCERAADLLGDDAAPGAAADWLGRWLDAGLVRTARSDGEP